VVRVDDSGAQHRHHRQHQLQHDRHQQTPQHTLMMSVMHAVDDVAHVTAPAALVMPYIATDSHGFHSSLHRTTRPQSTTVAIKR
jgi:predicted hydrolase (HD superfamily)